MVTRIKNAVFITDTEERSKSLYIEDGKIKAFTNDELPFDEEIDAEGLYVSPGFIDMHTHGAIVLMGAGDLKEIKNEILRLI